MITKERVIKNQQFIHKIDSDAKTAAASTEKFIRDSLMEDVKMSEIMPIWDITGADLDRSATDNNPLIICDKEPDVEAYTVPFWSDTVTKIIGGTRFNVGLERLVTDRIILDRAQMLSYSFDLDSFLQDKIVKRLADPHDQGFVDVIDAIITANVATHRDTVFAFDASGFRIGMTKILHRKVPMSKMLMCEELYWYAVELPASAVGDDIAKRNYEEGPEVSNPRLFGKPCVLTIKNDIFDPTKVWFFTTADRSLKNYMGIHVRLEQPTLIIETRGPKVEFEAYTMVGAGIGNVKGIHEVIFSL